MTIFMSNFILNSPALFSDSGSATVMRGDLLILDRPFSETLDYTVLKAVCKRTLTAIEIPRDKLYILVTIDEPGGDMLVGCFIPCRTTG